MSWQRPIDTRVDDQIRGATLAGAGLIRQVCQSNQVEEQPRVWPTW